MSATREEFLQKVRNQWRNEFTLHRRALEIIEPAIAQPRKHADHVGLVLDMLFVQAYKSHVSVRFLAELGHMEDTATISRRLLEMSVLAGYITESPGEAQRLERADRYLANLWRELAREAREILPQAVQAFWDSVAQHVPPGAQPSFQKMFAEIGKHETYQQDYRLLTEIAHGSSSDQLVAFAQDTVPVRPDWHLGTLLVFASKYAIGIAILWNEIFKVIDDAPLETLIADLSKWPEGKAGRQASASATAP